MLLIAVMLAVLASVLVALAMQAYSVYSSVRRAMDCAHVLRGLVVSRVL